jgi:hypothetical protein
MVELIEYGESIKGRYIIVIDNEIDSVTIKFKDGDAIIDTLNRMVEQNIPFSARPYILEKLVK